MIAWRSMKNYPPSEISNHLDDKTMLAMEEDNHVALQYFLTFSFHSCLLSMQACKDSMSVAMLTACCKSFRVQVSLGRPRFLSGSSMSNFSLKTQRLNTESLSARATWPKYRNWHSNNNTCNGYAENCFRTDEFVIWLTKAGAIPSILRKQRFWNASSLRWPILLIHAPSNAYNNFWIMQTEKIYVLNCFVKLLWD